MRNVIIICAIALVAFVTTGCKEDVYAKPSYTDMRFDQDTIDLIVTPESSEFTIGFHKSSDPVPDQYDLVNINRCLVQATELTARPFVHYSFPQWYGNNDFIQVYYNVSPEKGTITIKVYPDQITKPLRLALDALASPNPRVVINLIPAP